LRYRATVALLLIGHLAVPGGALGKGSPTRATVDFTIRDITGKRFRLAERLEKGPVLLDFWALWCVPCLKELPELAKIWSRFQGSGLSVVAVNEDAPSDQAKVKPFIKRKRYGFTVAFDEDSDLWQQFNIDALPTVILLDHIIQIFNLPDLNSIRRNRIPSSLCGRNTITINTPYSFITY